MSSLLTGNRFLLGLSGSLALIGFGIMASPCCADDMLVASEMPNYFGHFSQNLTGTGLPPTNTLTTDGGYLIKPNYLGDKQEGTQIALQKAPVACVPTAVANSFVFLQNQYGIRGLGGADASSATGYAPISYDTINTLASSTYMNTKGEIPVGYNGPPGYQAGTSMANFVEGKEKYLQDDAANIKDANGNPVAIQTVGQSVNFSQAADGPWIGGVTKTTPTAAFIQQQLDAKEDIEIVFSWTNASGTPLVPGGIGHCVDLDAINYDATTNSGSISFIDPYASSGGLPSYNTLAPQITSTSFTKLANGLLRFSYRGGAAGVTSAENSSGAVFGVITSVIAESPVAVPSPSSAVGGLCLVGILVAANVRERIVKRDQV
jgi:hypothetical protein